MYIDKYDYSTSYFKTLVLAFFVEHGSEEDFFEIVENIADIDNITDIWNKKLEDILKD